MMFGYGMGGFGFVFMLLIGVLTVAFVIWLVTVLARGITPPQTPPNGLTSSQRPLDIAQQRFARGEITKAEYEDIRHTLGSA